MNRSSASSLRQRILVLHEERHSLEEQLLEVRSLLRGSLVARRFLHDGKPRGNPAHYLFRRDEGKRRMIYIPRKHLEWARREAEAYRRYRTALRRLRAL